MSNPLLKPIRIVRHYWRQLKTFFKWIPTIWADAPWDYCFIYDILEKKLSLMKEFYSSDRCWSIEGSDIAGEIAEIITILNRLQKGEYTLVGLEEFERTYPDYDWSIKREPILDKPGWSTLVNNDTPEQQELMKKCFAKGDALEQKDLDDLFILLRKNIQKWWD